MIWATCGARNLAVSTAATRAVRRFFAPATSATPLVTVSALDGRKELFVDDPSQVAELTQYIRASKTVGIDTEFIAHPFYAPKLEVVQISTPDILAVVDYQKVKNAGLREIHQAWKDKECIFHSGGYDLKLIGHLCDTLPDNIFDTQEAASYAGLGPMLGLKAVVEACIPSIEMDKSMTLSNWSHRPLTKDQIKYAADDVRYLQETREVLIEKLEALGRLEMFRKEMKLKSDPKTYAPPDPSTLWETVRKTRKMEGRDLAILRELAILRDRIARENNKSPEFFMRDDVMAGIVHVVPTSHGDLYGIQGVSAGSVGLFGNLIIEAVQKGVDTAEADWPVRDPLMSSAEEKHRQLHSLMSAWIQSYCLYELKIGDDLVNPRRSDDLMALILTPDEKLDALKENRFMSGWRREYFLDKLLAIKNGTKKLQFNPESGLVELV
ncbi:hypothetical protein SARC_08393 [Sphaeroforma arctica JP610]|uniref:HRDC domain-containing protein n=1 Tax=Sphaeroforma arctica JP610 TaxID=667725 RepID=A0A0L0FRL8_9EUKA|nr:hypothetical protein SARC_08393 [Sphaeroforma arctica JP610]KNC79206.1 hypothetical protein SARC_08393 [Sphaeroforma arctica JP610]|eukprot:XP_014153108.1 hypothetical protein SARC_08393 [Sphaeroforma arctica JP610]